jgi:uncharacterized membrane protein
MNMKEFLKRLASPVTIPAVAALVYFVVKTWVGFEIPGWDNFVTLLVAALLALGIVNNPADKDNF